ncbi:exported hypothetical protein [uncultured Desulfatiglans sp.]|nr:exported hypothetical protein [uncultured Desulfatiglans sp.]
MRPETYLRIIVVAAALILLSTSVHAGPLNPLNTLPQYKSNIVSVFKELKTSETTQEIVMMTVPDGKKYILTEFSVYDAVMCNHTYSYILENGLVRYKGALKQFNSGINFSSGSDIVIVVPYTGNYQIFISGYMLDDLQSSAGQ